MFLSLDLVVVIPFTNSLLPPSILAGTKNLQPSHHASGIKKKSCVYCAGNHAPSTCNTISDPTKHLEIVKQQTALPATRYPSAHLNTIVKIVYTNTITSSALRNPLPVLYHLKVIRFYPAVIQLHQLLKTPLLKLLQQAH